MADRQHTAVRADELATHGADALEARGHRVTPQRRAILEFLQSERCHKTPQDIFGALESRVSSLSLATVYNTLELFHDIGLLRKFTDQQGQTYFDPNLEPHHHAICDDCGEIFDCRVSPETVENLVSSSKLAGEGGFDVQETTIWFKGACAECRRSLH
jgi:Fe2+ or Zn2+ uptake regulation protein